MVIILLNELNEKRKEKGIVKVGSQNVGSSFEYVEKWKYPHGIFQ